MVLIFEWGPNILQDVFLKKKNLFSGRIALLYFTVLMSVPRLAGLETEHLFFSHWSPVLATYINIKIRTPNGE